MSRVLDQVQWTGAWNPTPLLTVEFTGERNIGRLPSGRFTQTVVGNRLRVNISPDLSIASYVQYDTDSNSLGTNTRLRWTFRPVADLFVVYNRWRFLTAPARDEMEAHNATRPFEALAVVRRPRRPDKSLRLTRPATAADLAMGDLVVTEAE